MLEYGYLSFIWLGSTVSLIWFGLADLAKLASATIRLFS